jgi:hypothetical protein
MNLQYSHNGRGASSPACEAYGKVYAKKAPQVSMGCLGTLKPAPLPALDV